MNLSSASIAIQLLQAAGMDGKTLVGNFSESPNLLLCGTANCISENFNENVDWYSDDVLLMHDQRTALKTKFIKHLCKHYYL